MNISLRVCNASNNLKTIAVIATMLVLAGCASMNPPERQPIALEQIVALAKEGKDAVSIIQMIKESRTTYDVMASQYAKLSRDGVPDQVLDFMQFGQLMSAERQGRRNAYNDLWYSSGAGWGYGGIWQPRAYFVYVNGRPHSRVW